MWTPPRPDRTGASPPSIRARLANALAVWGLAWGLAVGVAAWLAATHELDELLDDTLRDTAQTLAEVPLSLPASARGPEARQLTSGDGVRHYAWQVVAADGSLRLRSGRAPAEPWRRTPSAGFGQAAEWRIFGLALREAGLMLYVGQTLDERVEARQEVTWVAGLAALAMAVLGQVWLRQRVRRELEPLQTLSDRLRALDWRRASRRAELGPPERQELEPVVRAVEDLTERAARQLMAEQAFAAHAAHALRTPLAGIDAQLAVSARDAPPDMRARLQRVRSGAARLQTVVTALLSLFRTGAEPQRQPVQLADLVGRLPVADLQLSVSQGAALDADPDLLVAALSNLLDNASRHGARHVTVRVDAPQRLVVEDDGPGLPADRRAQLQAALDGEAYEGRTGLGLMLADRVARAHGGRLRLLARDRGLAVELSCADTGTDAAAGPTADGLAPPP